MPKLGLAWPYVRALIQARNRDSFRISRMREAAIYVRSVRVLEVGSLVEPRACLHVTFLSGQDPDYLGTQALPVRC
jgi:hypothetical protein